MFIFRTAEKIRTRVKVYIFHIGTAFGLEPQNKLRDTTLCPFLGIKSILIRPVFHKTKATLFIVTFGIIIFSVIFLLICVPLESLPNKAGVPVAPLDLTVAINY
jgi:hypothetical protein